MKSKIIKYFLFVLITIWSSYSVADGIVKGKVEFIRTHDATAIPSWSPPLFWFTLKGVTSAGTCKKWVDGKILFAAKDTQTLNLVMAAIQTNKEIAVSFKESNLQADGYCTINYITIGNPVAPLY